MLEKLRPNVAFLMGSALIVAISAMFALYHAAADPAAIGGVATTFLAAAAAIAKDLVMPERPERSDLEQVLDFLSNERS